MSLKQTRSSLVLCPRVAAVRQRNANMKRPLRIIRRRGDLNSARRCWYKAQQTYSFESYVTKGRSLRGASLTFPKSLYSCTSKAHTPIDPVTHHHRPDSW